VVYGLPLGSMKRAGSLRLTLAPAWLRDAPKVSLSGITTTKVMYDDRMFDWAKKI
jgi:hypothetical protein